VVALAHAKVILSLLCSRTGLCCPPFFGGCFMIKDKVIFGGLGDGTVGVELAQQASNYMFGV
jgi:hypothetical protein